MPRLDQPAIPAGTGSIRPEPLAATMAGRSSPRLGAPGGPTRFGACLAKLPPGSRSGQRNRHATGDGLIPTLGGEVVPLAEDGTVLRTGDLAARPAGHPAGRCPGNRSPAGAVRPVVGTRRGEDAVHHPDAGITPTRRGRHRRCTDAAGPLLHETGR